MTFTAAEDKTHPDVADVAGIGKNSPPPLLELEIRAGASITTQAPHRLQLRAGGGRGAIFAPTTLLQKC